jgi:TDG/mug DNA glycosylase family protein
LENSPTLPDYLAPGLSILFVGINPGLLSAQRGHYFARRSNRFWPAFSLSRLSEHVRRGLGRGILGPEDDAALLEFGIGFTDVVKRPTRNASELNIEEFKAGAPLLLQVIERYQPHIACFHGLTGYRPFVRYAFGDRDKPGELGLQRVRHGATAFYVVPSPSPANAHYRLEDQIAWYDRLADTCAERLMMSEHVREGDDEGGHADKAGGE